MLVKAYRGRDYSENNVGAKVSMTATESDLVFKEKADEIVHAHHVDQSPSPEILSMVKRSKTKTQLRLHVLRACVEVMRWNNVFGPSVWPLKSHAPASFGLARSLLGLASLIAFHLLFSHLFGTSR